MEKQKSKAFGKDVYLLGADSEGVYYWLEAPTWDCGWYWGFGYIETYTNNKNPEYAKDINSHSHATNFLSEYFTEWNGSEPILKDKTFSYPEGWELCELFKAFYLLQDYAELKYRGSMNCSSSEVVKKLEDKEEAKRINEKDIPSITARILEILTPKENN